jgi:hypothetical protein
MSEISQEKGFLPESQLGQEDAPILRQKRTPINPFWWLLLCLIVTTAWFTRSHHPCSHLSIEKRVQKILSQTPLFGMVAEEYTHLITDGYSRWP